MFSDIDYEVVGAVAVIALNRPDKLNAWTPTMGREVKAAMRRATDDAGVRAVVLTGRGRGFCAGADMTSLSAISASGGMAEAPDEPFDPDSPPDFQRRYAYFPAVPKPIIAAINGPCAGLGLVMALYCDMRFAAPEASFTTAFARRGLIAEHGISWLLPRLVGPSKAADLLLSARKVDAREALAMGLVDRLSDGAVLEVALDYARELAALSSPRSMRVIKRQLWGVATQTLGEAVDDADREMHLSLASEDFGEGVRHFLEKRPPRFPNV